jgi:hypothetical protein
MLSQKIIDELFYFSFARNISGWRDQASVYHGHFAYLDVNAAGGRRDFDPIYINIVRYCRFLGIPDVDTLVRGLDPDSVRDRSRYHKAKIIRKTLILTVL